MNLLDINRIPISTEETLDNVSFGLNGILNMLVSMTNENNKPIWDTILINVYTLIRNNININKTINKIKTDTLHDISVLLQYFSQYMELDSSIDKPYIVFYLPKYNIPINHKRENNNQLNILLDKAYENFLKDYSTDHSEEIYQNLIVHTLKVGRHRLPHYDLKRWIEEKFNINRVRIINRRFALISHCPIDFHFCHFYKNLHLLESYTGKIKTPQLFGLKIFNSSSVPFNKITHIVFGDKEQIKPLVVRNNRKILLDVSVTNRWNIKPEASILADIKKSSTISDINSLTDFNL